MQKPTRNIALITARGGSKRLANKNILDLGGKPLIAWSIEAALNTLSINRVIVSTDDDIIAAAAREAGAEVPFMRPSELAGDKSAHIDVIRHAIDFLKAKGDDFTHLMLLQPTSPFRTTQDIDNVIDISNKNSAQCVVSVSKVEHHPALMFRSGEDALLRPYLPPTEGYVRTQDLEPLYALNGALYLFEVESLMQRTRLLPDEIYPYVMPSLRAIDIDTQEDLDLTQAVLAAGMVG